MTFTAIVKTIKWYLNFYGEFIANWWDHISFTQYVLLMVLSLVVGYYLMQRDANRAG